MRMQTLSAISLAIAALSASLHAQTQPLAFTPGNLVVSRSVYQGTAATVTIGQTLPPNCTLTTSTSCATAVANGAFPGVWQNAKPDGSFGVTSPIFLDHMSASGTVLNTVAIDPTALVTSFSSKSELALNLSTDGTDLTFMGYSLGSPSTTSLVNNLDVSNSNTPGVIDPTNPAFSTFFRGVGRIDGYGSFVLAAISNAYGGNNGRAAIYANRASDPSLFYTVGNSNNGSGTPTNVVTSTGLEVMVPGATFGSGPYCTVTVFIGSCPVMVDPNLVTNVGDKAGKDSNFRGIAIAPGANGNLYITKGSGSNGIDTVYVVTPPVGSLPTLLDAPVTAIAVAPGFPTAPAKTAGIANIYPFGLWFANATTLYVADEGDGVIADAAKSTYAGLQKWTFNGKQWSMQYVLQSGLNLGQQYSVSGYPSSLNPAPDGLRNLTGRVNGDGTVTIWAITSTISANGDQGADPNQLVTINDTIAATGPNPPAGETFSVVRTAAFGEVLRGVSLAPGTSSLATQ